MADITVPSIPPIAPITGNTQVATTLLKALSQISVVTGTVTGKDTSGNFLLQTEQGTIALSSNLPLATGSEVTLGINNAASNNQTNAKIIAVNGDAVEETATPTPQTSGNTQDSISETLQTRSSLLSGNPFSSMVKAQIVATAPSVPTASLPALSEEVILYLPETASPAQTPPEATIAENTNTPLPAAPPVAVTTTIPVEEATAPQTTQPLVNNTTPAQAQASENPLYTAFVRNVSAVLPANEDNLAVAGKLMPAQLVGENQDGTVTLQTSQGTITVKPEMVANLAQLKAGTGVLIEFSAPASQAPAASPLPADFVELAANWDSLKTLLTPETDDQTTEKANPPANSNPLPATGTNFVSRSFTLLQSFFSGSATVEKMLGDATTNQLKNEGKTDLLQKFTAELKTVVDTASGNAQATHNTSWQALILPFMYEENLQQARIYVKRENSEKNNNTETKRSSGTRFVLEVNLSEMGGVQMDGLVKRLPSQTIFDLVVRTNTPLNSAEQNDISTIYHSVAQQTGFAGNISFETAKDFTLKPLDEVQGNHSHAMVV